MFHCYILKIISFILFYLQLLNSYHCYKKIKHFSLSNNLNAKNYKRNLENIYMSSNFGFLPEKSSNVEVIIESPSLNTRRITASILIDSSIDDIWSILTDYNNLSTHVPNLTQSYLINVPEEPEKLRLYQEGAQKIIGFDFRASLLMDMLPLPYDENLGLKEKVLSFKLIESKMFKSFDGTWSLRYHSRTKEYDSNTNTNIYKYKTKLTYTVFVAPRGPVPVIALEWRVREDIPTNLKGIELATFKLKNNRNNNIMINNNNASSSNNNNIMINNNNVNNNNVNKNNGNNKINIRSKMNWDMDETLESYITYL